MKNVKALRGFEHGQRRRRDDEFEVSDTHAESLERRGLVRIVGDAVVSDGESRPGAGAATAPAGATRRSSAPKAKP